MLMQHTHAHKHMYTHTHAHTHAHARTHARTHTHVHTHVHTHTHARARLLVSFTHKHSRLTAPTAHKKMTQWNLLQTEPFWTGLWMFVISVITDWPDNEVHYAALWVLALTRVCCAWGTCTGKRQEPCSREFPMNIPFKLSTCATTSRIHVLSKLNHCVCMSADMYTQRKEKYRISHVYHGRYRWCPGMHDWLYFRHATSAAMRHASIVLGQ